jgi:hypothetical protein
MYLSVLERLRELAVLKVVALRQAVSVQPALAFGGP